jgi:phage baseplate assembly protein W
MYDHYKDINLNFERHPGTGDIQKKYDVDAVKQSLKTLLLSSVWDHPFDPYFGVNLQDWIFELNVEGVFGTIALDRRIRETISRYDPRIRINDLQIYNRDDHITIDMVFSTEFIKTADFSLNFKRLR